MANFDHQTLEHLKKLCRVECSQEEDQDIIDSLARILNYVEQLNEIDTDQVKACRYVLRGMLKNQMRADVVEETLSREQFLANAPDQIGGMVRTPPILPSSS